MDVSAAPTPPAAAAVSSPSCVAKTRISASNSCDAFSGFESCAENSSAVRASGSRPSEVTSTSGSSLQGTVTPDLACQLTPVHLGHQHVEDGDVERSPASISSSARAGELRPGTASMPHERACRLTISRLVALSSTTSRRLPSICGCVRADPDACRHLGVFRPELDPEGRPVAFLALDRRVAAHQLGEAPARSRGRGPCRRTGGSSTRRPG